MANNGKRLGFLPGWRIFSYIILLFNLIMLIWVIGGAIAGHNSKSSCGSLSAQDCQGAKDVGTAIGVTALIFIWVLVDIILLVLWLVTNRKKRECPVCGRDVNKGVMQCRNCGHDFRQQYQQQPSYGPRQPQYQQQPSYGPQQPQYQQQQPSYGPQQYGQPVAPRPQQWPPPPPPPPLPPQYPPHQGRPGPGPR